MRQEELAESDVRTDLLNSRAVVNTEVLVNGHIV